MQSRLDELLQAGRRVQPPAGAEERIWTAVEHRVLHGPPPPPAVEAASTGLGGALAGKLTLKWIVGLLLIAGVGAGAGLATHGHEDAPAKIEPPRASTVAVAPAPMPVIVEAPVQPTPVVVAAPPEGIAGPDLTVVPGKPERPREARKSAKRAVPDIAAEMRMLLAAREALARGDGRGALAKLAEHRREFGPHADLLQERMALEVDALCARGRVTEAQKLAANFLVRWPDSTHAPGVRGSCAEPKGGVR